MRDEQLKNNYSRQQGIKEEINKGGDEHQVECVLKAMEKEPLMQRPRDIREEGV